MLYWCHWWCDSCIAVPILDKLKIDDVVGAISVHGIAGIWGTIAVVFSGGSIGAQIIGTVSICLFIFICPSNLVYLRYDNGYQSK